MKYLKTKSWMNVKNSKKRLNVYASEYHTLNYKYVNSNNDIEFKADYCFKMSMESITKLFDFNISEIKHNEGNLDQNEDKIGDILLKTDTFELTIDGKKINVTAIIYDGNYLKIINSNNN